MISLNKFPKITKRSKKRLGQGHGSGKVKTGGRGTKGQRSRGKIPLSAGIIGPILVRRLPLFRGKWRNKPLRRKTLVINIKYLEVFPKGTIVDRESLIKNGIIDKGISKETIIKILGDGKINIPITVKLPCSRQAEKKIVAAGGKVEK